MFYLCSFYLKISFGNFVGDNNTMTVTKKAKGRHRKCPLIPLNLGTCIFHFISQVIMQTPLKKVHEKDFKIKYPVF